MSSEGRSQVSDVTHRAKPCPDWFALITMGSLERRMQGFDNLGKFATDQEPWWALYTRHQHEKTVEEMLMAKGFEVFLDRKSVV